MGSRGRKWTAPRRSRGLGGGLDLGAEGEEEGGVKDGLRLLLIKLDGGICCGEEQWMGAEFGGRAPRAQPGT